MTEQTDDLVLGHLRDIRACVDRMEGRLDDLTLGVGNLEKTVARVGVTLAEHSVQMDKLEFRLTRIERRLDLVGA